MDDELDLGATADQIGEALFGPGGELGAGEDDIFDAPAPPAQRAAEPKVEDANVIAETKKDPAAAPAPADPNAAPTPTAPEDPLAKPPKTWKAEEAAGWETLTPTQRAAIHRREDDFHKGIETYKGNAAKGIAFDQMLAPFAPAMQQFGLRPEQVLPSMMHAHLTLSLGRPEEKVALLRNLLRDYRIDPAALGAPSDPPPFVDPTVQHLQGRLETLESTQRAAEQAALAQRKAAVSAELEAFFADEKNIYVKEVADDMAALIRGSGGTMKLGDAYERAVWANPATRLKETQRQQAAAQEEAKKAAEAAAAAAKANAAANVKASTKRVGQTASAGSMDDTLAETLKRIRSRG